MELILGFSLAFNIAVIGLWFYAKNMEKKQKKIFKQNIEKQAEGFTKKYIEIYKDYVTHA